MFTIFDKRLCFEAAELQNYTITIYILQCISKCKQKVEFADLQWCEFCSYTQIWA